MLGPNGQGRCGDGGELDALSTSARDIISAHQTSLVAYRDCIRTGYIVQMEDFDTMVMIYYHRP